MTPRENFIKAVRGEEPERLAVMTLTSGVWVCSKNGQVLEDNFTGRPESLAQILINHYEKAGTDVIWIGADCNNVVLTALGADCDYSRPGGASTVRKPLISTASETENLDLSAISSHPWVKNLVGTAKKVCELNCGNRIVGVSSWGPFTLASQMLGLENLIFMMMDEPESLIRVIDFCAAAAERYLKCFEDTGAELFNLSEPVASCDMISGDNFREYAAPYIKKVYSGLCSSDVRMLHICGNTEPILSQIPDTGTEIFSLDTKTGISKAYDILCGRVCAAGNLDPVGVLLTGDEKKVRGESERIFSQIGSKRGFILMPGCDVPPDTVIENVRAMADFAYSAE